ncbi:TPA: hypothetical protein RP447_000801 [Acinetobacter baumannii]|nr:hypothetical protein [Acinetobacter baumannii]HDX6121087.1 hypothetical protein [Acinetobacter baumannii]
MDKKALQEQFEAIAVQNCWNINKYPAGWDGHGDDEYADDFVSGAWWGFQHQQAKVEEANAKAQMCRDEKNHAINRWSAVCKERDELQKRVDSIREVLDELQEQADVIRKRGQKFRDSSFLASADMMDICIKEIEQALKGGEA